MRYKRILLKLSGEALKGKTIPLDPEKLEYVTNEIVKLYRSGIQIAIVVGGGNISRGTLGEFWGIDPVDADINGILSTLVNAGWISSILEKKIGEENVCKMVTVPSSYVGEMYSPRKAKSNLQKNKIVVIGGGTGISLCTTDTAAVQRAIELESDAVLMLKNGVDGVYEKDPKEFSNSRMFNTISFDDFKKLDAAIVDETAAVVAAKYRMPIHFVNFLDKDVMIKVCEGQFVGTYVGNIETTLA